MESKRIIFGHINYADKLLFSLMSTSEKSKNCLSKKEKMQWNRKRIFFLQKSQETARWEPLRKAAHSEHSIAIHSISKAGYVIAVLAICQCRAPCLGGEQFLSFLKKAPLAIWPYLTCVWLKQTFVFEMCLVKSNTANLCPSMVHFNECRSEVVISFFWSSVYYNQALSLC